MIITILGYLLFFYTAWLGYERLKPTIFDPRKLFIMPLIFAFLSIWGLIAGFQGIIGIIVWLIFLLIGYALGRGLASPLKVRADKQKMLMGLSGSPVPLMLVLIFFAGKFLMATLPDAKTGMFPFLNIILTSLITGAFIGQTMTITKKLSKAKHEKLRKKKK